MKTNKIALIAIALWLLMIAAFAWFFVHGSTVPGTDSRTAVVLKADERRLILQEMRGLLSATHDILDGINQGDMAHVAKAARSAGMAAAADVNPALMAKLPLPFKSLGMSVHEDMDEIAQAAEAGEPAPGLLKRLTAATSKCVACHAGWQLNTGQ
jgi:hypothetical protein